MIISKGKYEVSAIILLRSSAVRRWSKMSGMSRIVNHSESETRLLTQEVEENTDGVMMKQLWFSQGRIPLPWYVMGLS